MRRKKNIKEYLRSISSDKSFQRILLRVLKNIAKSADPKISQCEFFEINEKKNFEISV